MTLIESEVKEERTYRVICRGLENRVIFFLSPEVNHEQAKEITQTCLNRFPGNLDIRTKLVERTDRGIKSNTSVFFCLRHEGSVYRSKRRSYRDSSVMWKTILELITRYR